MRSLLILFILLNVKPSTAFTERFEFADFEFTALKFTDPHFTDFAFANRFLPLCSRFRFQIDKRCQHRCSWKCLSIALILLSIILATMVAYFASKYLFPLITARMLRSSLKNSNYKRRETSLGARRAKLFKTSKSRKTGGKVNPLR